MIASLLFVLALSANIPTLQAFGVAPRVWTTNTRSSIRRITTTRRYSSGSNREEEIARLEEQLRQLKQEEQDSPPVDENRSSVDTVNGQNEQEESVKQQLIDSFTQSTSPAQQQKLFVDRQVILSEQELVGVLEDDNADMTESGGGFVTPILAVVGIVFLLLFSQVPVGQESLSKYSATGAASTVQTIDLGDLNTDVPSSS
mmetsp:Transcript_17778/g.36799  ORF Transcript_17778/g.36799 Transcript_17778/m.36799 type:complete len:201 (-) Transcript_17778:276-878(-)